jgi:hypothetical protein
MEEVKRLDGLVIGGYNTLTIVGLTVDDEEFWGEQDILVIDVSNRELRDQMPFELHPDLD